MVASRALSRPVMGLTAKSELALLLISICIATTYHVTGSIMRSASKAMAVIHKAFLKPC